jgi:hypothetical protein
MDYHWRTRALLWIVREASCFRGRGDDMASPGRWEEQALEARYVRLAGTGLVDHRG